MTDFTTSLAPVAPAAVSTSAPQTAEMERLGALSETKVRRTIESESELGEGYPGEEAIIVNQFGGSDLKKKVGDRWVTFSGTLDGVTIQTDKQGVPGVCVEIKGKRYRIPFVEVQG